jgi:imidazolonepropionase-like amidohydrolase
MKKLSIFLAVVISYLPQISSAETTLIKAKAYVDVRNGKLIEPAAILIKDDLILAINPETTPDNTKIIDLKNKILLPGLMDMHVHLDLDFNGSFDSIIYKESASKGAIRAATNAKKTLLAGFTTIRNVGQGHITKELVNVAVSEASDQGWIIAPRIIAAGHMITITGGHGDLIMGMAENFGELGPESGVVNGVDEAIKAVRYQIKHGARVIKIHATAGVLSLEDSVGAQQLNNQEMEAIVAEAARHHIKVAAHAHGAEGIIAAINAGVSSIEHGSLLNDKGIKLMKKKGVYLVPTTGLVDEVIKNSAKMNPKMAKKAQYVLPLAQKNLSIAIKAGVKIALGTDAPLILHGENAKELTALVERGMTNKEALKSATINSADLLGLTDRGEIKVGSLADIIAVDANPLEDIKTMEAVRFVMKGGKVYKKE